MTHDQQVAETDTYRLVLISARTRVCKVEYSGGGAHLPRVTIPKWTRVAGEVADTIKERWGLTVVVLDIVVSLAADAGCVIAELFGSGQEIFANESDSWCNPSDLSSQELTETEQKIIESLLAEGTTGRGPFSRLGWFNESIEWLRSEVPDNDFDFSGNFRQFNASPTFALIRIDNNKGCAYWIKAVGEPNQNEFAVTKTLAELCPTYIPTILAMRSDWNAWIMRDAGSRLSKPMLLHELNSVVAGLAELQASTLAYSQRLISAGCFDQRGNSLIGYIPQLIEYLTDAMGNQTSTATPRVGELRLLEIGSLLASACEEMISLRIPDTVIHNDFSFGNILLTGSRCVFTDWAEGCVGNPLMTYQHLRNWVDEDTEAVRWLPELDHIYKRSMQEVAGDLQLDKALVLSPFLAIASHLLGRAAWLTSPSRFTPNFQRYARGLARRLDRAAAAPQLQGAI